jgi:hypothetical protein
MRLLVPVLASALELLLGLQPAHAIDNGVGVTPPMVGRATIPYSAAAEYYCGC